MSERKPSPLLDPYCTICKEYKGVGPCKRATCVSVVQSDIGTLSRIGFKQMKTCQKCDKSAYVFCHRCGNGFCNEHSKHKDGSKFIEFSQFIGKCNTCQNYVCEQCWIIVDLGKIECVHNHESSNT